MDNDSLDKIRQANEKKAQVQLDQSRHEEEMQHARSLESILFQSFQSLVSVLEGNGEKGEAIGLIVNALDKLDKASDLNKNDVLLVKQGLTELEKQLKDIPVGDLKQIPKFLQQREVIKVSNLSEMDKGFKLVEAAIKSLKLDVKAPVVRVDAPQITTPTPVVNVPKTDLEPLKTTMLDVVKAVRAIKPATFTTDNKDVEALLKKQNKILKDLLEKPIGGGGGGGGSSWIATNTAGTPIPIQLQSDGSVPVTVLSGGGGGGGTQYQQGATTAPATGNVVLARYNSTLPTLTDGQLSTPQLDTRGGLQIVVTDRDGTSGSVVGSQATNLVTNINGLQTRSTTYGQFDDVSPGALTEDRLGIQRMSANRNAYITLRDAAGNERGQNVDSSGNASTAEGYMSTAEDNTNGVIASTQKPVVSATYGYTTFTDFSTVTAYSLKITPGLLSSVVATNANIAVRWLQFHNKASAPASTNVPIMSFPMPAGTALNPVVLILGSDFLGLNGTYFSTGVAIGISTTQGTYTAATAGDHTLNAQYK
jgi:hypothetical protein